VKRKALAEKSVIIPPNTTITVPAMCAPLAKGCNYMFEASFAGACDTIMEHATATTNSSDKPKKVLTKIRLGTYETDGCY
jgi:hypothetical protein